MNTGKIHSVGALRLSWGDHPREYGENLTDYDPFVIDVGSSP